MGTNDSLGTLGQDGTLYCPAADSTRTEAMLPSFTVQNHAANIMPLANGDLLCVWFSGTEEGKPDISIYMSRLNQGTITWSQPVKLSDDASRSEQNPVLFPAPDGRLWLLYTAQESSHQETAEVYFRISEDNGYNWSETGTLFDQPGTFIRQTAVVLDNGDWLLPVFHCQVQPGQPWQGNDDYSAVKISSDQGQTWQEYVVPDSTGCVHMNVEKLPDGTLLALFRSRWADHIYASRSDALGRVWTEPAPTELPNNNSSIQFTKLNNGHFALVFNNMSAANATERRFSLYDGLDNSAGADQSKPPLQGVAGKKMAFWGAPRAPLTIAISQDGGRTWPYMRDLEIGDGYCMTNNSAEKLNREYSYPSVKGTPDGKIHIAFTYFRQRIKYVCIEENWVTAAQG